MACAGSGTMIPLAERVEQYLTQRDRFGTGLSASAIQVLRKFALFADNQGAERVTTDLFLCWKEQSGSKARWSWGSRLSHVRTFCRWLQSVDPRTEVPSLGLIPRNRQRPKPYIYTDDELAGIMTETARLPSKSGLRGPTYATLFGLLTVTGLRISEALGLDDNDVDPEAALLRIRHTKKDRSRIVAITPCTAERLMEYRSLRDRTLGAVETSALFVGERRRRVRIGTAEYNFVQVSQRIGLRECQPTGHAGRGPRLHDMRHTMAVRTVINWYRSGLNPEREMYKLSTWLGHKSPSETYWYLEAVPERLQLATERAERCPSHGERA